MQNKYLIIIRNCEEEKKIQWGNWIFMIQERPYSPDWCKRVKTNSLKVRIKMQLIPSIYGLVFDKKIGVFIAFRITPIKLENYLVSFRNVNRYLLLEV